MDGCETASTSCVPEKKIKTIFFMHSWRFSKAYEDYMAFLHNVNNSIVNVETTSDIAISKNAMKMIDLLAVLKKWISEFPPEEMGSQRYGNRSFRKWSSKLNSEAKELVRSQLGEELDPYLDELLPYFLDSFGNSERIDYGSGHEAQFLIFLLCLLKVEYFSVDDYQSIALRIFNAYLKLCRSLQMTYKLEPAGSQGFMALDDYQFVPFIFGSAQFIDQKRFIPDHYLNIEKVELYAHRSLFVEAIMFIHNTKSGPFHEHSNKLWNISNVQTWAKVNEGMFKMYEAEVLRHFPVVQHFLFGKLFSFDEIENAPSEPLERAKTPNKDTAMAHETLVPLNIGPHKMDLARKRAKTPNKEAEAPDGALPLHSGSHSVDLSHKTHLETIDE